MDCENRSCSNGLKSVDFSARTCILLSLTFLLFETYTTMIDSIEKHKHELQMLVLMKSMVMINIAKHVIAV